jgi:IMP dehydrogenase
MRGIVNADFALKLSELGGLAVLHRFYDTDEEWFNELEFLSAQPRCKFGAAIGLEDLNLEKVIDYNPDILVIDVSNAYTSSLRKYCEFVKKTLISKNSKIILCSGNICTKEGVQNLKDSGVDIVRVGIGGGFLCKTRAVTGVAIPQISALLECSEVKDIILCSDGGISSSGDFVKAIVGGADCAMSGTLFAKTYESANKDGLIYGMASKRLMDEMGYTAKSVEGVEKLVDKKMHLSQFIDEFTWGVRSAGTYLDAKSLDEIRVHGEFVLCGANSIRNMD